MTTADRAQDDLETVAAAVAAARPDPFPRWFAPLTTGLLVVGFAALAVALWTMARGWGVLAVALLLAFPVVISVAVLRSNVRAYPSRGGWRRHGVDLAVIAAAVAVGVLVDGGAGALLAGLGLGVTWWIQVRAEQARP